MTPSPKSIHDRPPAAVVPLLCFLLVLPISLRAEGIYEQLPPRLLDVDKDGVSDFQSWTRTEVGATALVKTGIRFLSEGWNFGHAYRGNDVYLEVVSKGYDVSAREDWMDFVFTVQLAKAPFESLMPPGPPAWRGPNGVDRGYLSVMLEKPSGARYGWIYIDVAKRAWITDYYLGAFGEKVVTGYVSGVHRAIIERLEGGLPGIKFECEGGFRYTVEASSDLSVWFTVSTHAFDEEGVVEVVFDQGVGRLFYRVQTDAISDL